MLNNPTKEKLSVVTVCYNAVDYIETALRSVQDQTYTNIEHVVIDGGSTDGTLDIIERFRDGISYFVSESDNGLYHAMNKGIKAASGDIFYFLNADDRFCDNNVATDIMAVFSAKPELELVYGDIILDKPESSERILQMPTLERKRLARENVCHQAIFVRSEMFGRTGGFNETFRIVADYDWLMKLVTSGVRARYICRDIAVIGVAGLSHTTSWEKEKRCAMSAFYTRSEIFFWRTIPRQIWPVIRRALLLLKLAFHPMAWNEYMARRRDRSIHSGVNSQGKRR